MREWRSTTLGPRFRGGFQLPGRPKASEGEPGSSVVRATSARPGDRLANQNGKLGRHPISMHPLLPAHLLAALALLLSAAIPAGGVRAQGAGDSARIDRIERRLWPAVTLAGTPDTGWSVAERMRRTLVPPRSPE